MTPHNDQTLSINPTPLPEIERPEEVLQEGEELRYVYHNLTEDAQFDLREQTDEKAVSTQVNILSLMTHHLMTHPLTPHSISLIVGGLNG